MLARAYAAKGMYKESEHAAEQARLLSNDPSANAFREAFQRGGRKAALRLEIENLNAEARKHYVSPHHYASLYAQLGDRQHALAYLDQCLDRHVLSILDVQNDPFFDWLHSDPHYRAIVKKTGLPPAW